MIHQLLARLPGRPRQSLYLGVAAVVLILVQLLAIGALAQGQIQKAQEREHVQTAKRVLIKRCLESRSVRIDLCAAPHTLETFAPLDHE